MRRKTWVAAAVASIFLLAGCGGEDAAEPEGTEQEQGGQEGQEGQEGQDPQEAPEMPEPDLEGLPDVVAVVNSTELVRDDFVEAYEGMFTQAAMQAQMTGEEVDQDALKEQTVEGMVDTELLLQEAEARDFEASDDDIDATIEELAAANGLESSEEFLTALEEQGMGAEEVREQVADQVRIEQVYSLEGGDYEPSDDEIEALYEEMVAQQPTEEGAEAPPELDEVRDELTDELENRHEQEVVTQLLEQMRDEADITINL